MPNPTGDLNEKVTELENRIDELADKDKGFARSLCDSFRRYSSLSDKQAFWVGKLLAGIGSDTGSSGGGAEIEEVFRGGQVTALLTAASSKLKFPRLRYQTDGGGTLIFSFATEGKWRGSTFISNSGKGENKVRYGFIDSHGNGRLNRTTRQEIKTAIRKIAENPIDAAKLSGQEYKNCCFCGLELTNKSSIHHGYGPICAENWGLPWGDTGDIEDEEKAAAEEMKHIQLHDLE